MGRPGELKRPVLADGPLKELNTALHELHLDAGLPSLTTMHRDLDKRISRSSLHDAFTSAARPAWDTVDALVEILASRSRRTTPEQELDRFHNLWMDAARSVLAEDPPPPASQNAQAAESGMFWVIATDVIQFSSASDDAQAHMRLRLYHDVAEALDFAGLISSAHTVDRGDGQLSLVPAEQTRIAPVLGFLLHLERLCIDHDLWDTGMKLRVAISRGVLSIGQGGWWGSELNPVSRILDSQPLRSLSRESGAHLTVAVTEAVHAELSDLKPRGFRPQFHQLRATTKEGHISFWAYQAPSSV
ncbi:hypothetical protein B0E38_01422 [Streptomyces sp. 111WW2]|uniref:hypothetical protein n=1 Tax=Streptomyces sp. 111WW2 TaxID=1945515 RepID=UPI000D2D7A26|nr:hypothetical protein [Streptomyces sp. 111WW2]PSK58397.1 hypothetical protein B0E38_01422 [Streptomyces sp. 111WW2]